MAISTKAAAPVLPDWWLHRPDAPPTQKEFARFLRSVHHEVQTWVARLAGGQITPDRFADELYRAMRSGHALGWMLGRQRAGDLTAFLQDDWTVGIAKADEDAEYILKWVAKLNARDKRYWDEAAQKWRASVIDNQARLYTQRIRGTANWAFEMSSEEGDFFDWVLGGVEEHCADCPDIARQNPWPKGTLGVMPGEGGTDCLSNCKCHIRRHADGQTGFRPVNLQSIGPEGEPPDLPDQGSDDGEPPIGEPVPVSAAIVMPSRGDARKIFRSLMPIIDKVHLDGDLPPIKVSAPANLGSLGLFTTRAGTGKYYARLAVQKDSEDPEWTGAHEVGHAIDIEALGYNISWTRPEFAAYREALVKTESVKRLLWLRSATESRAIFATGQDRAKAIQRLAYLDYLLRPVELWARAYAQFLAVRSKAPALIGPLRKDQKRGRESGMPEQWEDSDFKELEKAIIGAFVELGWMKKP